MNIPAADRMLFVGGYDDKPFLPQLKACVGTGTVYLHMHNIKIKYELKLLCEQKRLHHVISTNISLLERLLDWDKRKKPSLTSYAGSMFKLNIGGYKIEVLFIPPLKQLVTVPYGKFLTSRLITKFTQPHKWFKPTDFKWEIVRGGFAEDTLTSFSKAFMISVDIETVRENAAIFCVSYTAFFYKEATDTFTSHSVVLPIKDMLDVDTMRKFNNLTPPKVLQNGKYDIAYFARYNAPLYNYRYDTAHMFHAWYSELPKDLGFLNSFLIRDAVYWKDLAQTDDLMEYYRYNALDTWGTGNAFLAMMAEAEDYALTNYALEFPLVFPCHLSEMTGIKRDNGALQRAIKEQEEIIALHSASLNKMLDVPAFNTNSPKQMRQLLDVLGCKDIKKADEKSIEKARYRHPLNARILKHVIDIRKARKVLSTYLTTGDKAKEFKGRILYALNPHGTDSSRLASKEHHFWCGFNVQNQPRGKIVKQTYVADDGFLFAEVDLSQAESRDTAYISGDEALIAAVESPKDFHSTNASAFFGVPYEKIYNDELHKTIDKALRDLAKRVNHGANYNMGWAVLIDTMGEKKVYEAKRLLGLPVLYTARQVAEYLLASFHKTYPKIEESYYKGMVREVLLTGKLTSKAIHHDEHTPSVIPEDNYQEVYDSRLIGSWTRRCFGDPSKSKPQLNSYIAHCPQSLNAQTLNKAVLRVYKEVAINPKYSSNIKLLAQIHDSILFQYRIGHDYICEMVRERMEIPVTIKAYDDKVRTFTVPADIKAGIDGAPAKYWSETE